MCTSPIYINNPYYHIGSVGLNHLHDTRSAYVRVPCGRCSQCLSMRQGFYNQRIQMESLRSELFFFTLTYANRALMYTDIGNYRVAYPYYRDVQNLFHYLRNILPHPIRYMIVSEYGSKKKRPHYHGYIAVDKQDIVKYYRSSRLYCEKVLYKEVFANWKRNLSTSKKDPKYMQLSDFVYKFGRRTYDLHWVEPMPNHDNDVSFYLTKYILKYDSRTEKLLTKIKLDNSLTDEETKQLTSMIKPRCVMSKDFGSWKLPEVQKHINKCLSVNSDLPSYVDINTGYSMLLSPYYRKHLLPLDYVDKRYKDYVDKLRNLHIIFPYNSYNVDLLDDSTIYDLNCKAVKSFTRDSHLRKVKHCISRKS